MEVLEAIRTRRSIAKLVDPAPSAEVMNTAFRAAVCAPDHGRLNPWRFLVIEGEQRKQFGDLLAAALVSDQPDASDATIQREKVKALRAPIIVATVARITPDHAGVPPIEQILAVGAATQNLILALHAQGVGAIWRTGGGAYSPSVKRGLGLRESDEIIGFVYVGAIGAIPPAQPTNETSKFIEYWTGPVESASR
jgi:nitroreductase